MAVVIFPFCTFGFDWVFAFSIIPGFVVSMFDVVLSEIKTTIILMSFANRGPRFALFVFITICVWGNYVIWSFGGGLLIAYFGIHANEAVNQLDF